MKSVLAGGSCTAAILAFGIVAYAQTTGQSGQSAGQSSSQPTAQSAQSSDQQMTITGCVQREADYRRAHSKGQGGAAGTGVGAGNEFVLINASTSSASGSTPTGSTASGTGTSTGATGSSTAGTSTGTAPSAPGTATGMPSTSGSATGTTGTSGAQNAFELTGPGEGQLQQFIGKRVEIVGKLKGGHSATGASRTPSSTGTQSGTSTGTQSGTTTGTQSGSTTGTARSASDPMGQDLNLPEFEVVSVREASGSCPSTPDRQ